MSTNPDQQGDSSESPKGSLPRPEDSNSTSANGAVTNDSPLSERVDSLFGYDPTGEDPQSPLGQEGRPEDVPAGGLRP